MTATSAGLRQCVILAGGLGTRLGALGAATPKPVLPIGGHPFLFWLLRELQRAGFEEALLLSGHLSEALQDSVMRLAADLPRPMSIVFSIEPQPAGTGGALHHAAELLDERFLLCNGDSLFDTNLAALLAASSQDGPEVLARLLLRAVPDASRYGSVTRDGETVMGFYRNRAGPGEIHAGIGIFRREILAHLSPTGSLESDALPPLAEAGLLRAQLADGYFIDIGIPSDFARADAELAAQLQRRALFLDRDGVINLDCGYVGSVERFAFTRTALAAIVRATQAGWHVFIVTNQSGVARGYYTEADVLALHAWLREQVLRAGGCIDDIRFCPFHPDGIVAAYAQPSEWRKPQPGMLLDLIRAWDLNPACCAMIGDQITDLQAAEAAGVVGHLFDGDDLDALVKQVIAGA